MALLVAVFVLSAALDWLGILWHRAREAGHRWRGAGLSMLLEGLPWVALWVAIAENDWRVIAASILGSGVGSALGFRPPVPVGVNPAGENS